MNGLGLVHFVIIRHDLGSEITLFLLSGFGVRRLQLKVSLQLSAFVFDVTLLFAVGTFLQLVPILHVLCVTFPFSHSCYKSCLCSGVLLAFLLNEDLSYNGVWGQFVLG